MGGRRPALAGEEPFQSDADHDVGEFPLCRVERDRLLAFVLDVDLQP